MDGQEMAISMAAGPEMLRRPRHRRLGERLIEWGLAACGYVSVLALGGIFALLLWQGAKAFREVPLFEFLTSARWDPTSPEKAGYGILSMVASTALTSVGAMLFTVPLGVG